MILKTLEILQKVKNNELTIEQAQKMIEQPLDYATIDYNRKKRTGNNEVIYGAGKTKEQIIGIVKDMLDHDIHSILITRVDQEKSEAILKEFPQMIYDSLSHICYIDEDQKEINKGKIVVVCAGMEGALASVVGGLVDKPVIAVPTSIGYGANFDGLSALLAMLNSCASGVSVVNIDNGFGAGFMAHTINCLGGKK